MYMCATTRQNNMWALQIYAICALLLVFENVTSLCAAEEADAEDLVLFQDLSLDEDMGLVEAEDVGFVKVTPRTKFTTPYHGSSIVHSGVVVVNSPRPYGAAGVVVPASQVVHTTTTSRGASGEMNVEVSGRSRADSLLTPLSTRHASGTGPVRQETVRHSSAPEVTVRKVSGAGNASILRASSKKRVPSTKSDNSKDGVQDGPVLLFLGDSLTEGYGLDGFAASPDLWCNKVAKEIAMSRFDGNIPYVLNGGNSGAISAILTGAFPQKSASAQDPHVRRLKIVDGELDASNMWAESVDSASANSGAVRDEAGGVVLRFLEDNILGNPEWFRSDPAALSGANYSPIFLTTLYFGTNEFELGLMRKHTHALIHDVKHLIQLSVPRSQYTLVIIPFLRGKGDFLDQYIAEIKGFVDVMKKRIADDDAPNKIAVLDLNQVSDSDMSLHAMTVDEASRTPGLVTYFDRSLPGGQQEDRVHPGPDGHEEIKRAVLAKLLEMKM